MAVLLTLVWVVPGPLFMNEQESSAIRVLANDDAD